MIRNKQSFTNSHQTVLPVFPQNYNSNRFDFTKTENYKLINEVVSSSSLQCDGGGVQKQNEKESGRSLSVERSVSQGLGGQVDKRESLLKNKRIIKNQQANPRVIVPGEYESLDELFTACRVWWHRRYRKNTNTWDDYKGKLEEMAKHPIYPIDLLNINPDQVVAQLDFIEDEWRAKPGNADLKEGSYAIINKWKAIKALMRSYGRFSETDTWDYYPPPTPNPKPRYIPTVAIVHKMTKFDYSKDLYENKLYQHLMLFGYVFGPRPSSELSIMKVDDFDFETGQLTFYQPKVKRWRTIPVEKQLASASRNCKSFVHWIDKWRSKVENQYSKDFMFLQPSGKPFSEDFMAKKLRENAHKVWPKFYPYSMRHFCVNGRLVQSKVNSGYFDIKGVMDYMNHSRTDVTDRYSKDASRWYTLQPFDWFSVLLRFNEKTLQKIMEQHKNAEPKIDKKQKLKHSCKSLKRQNKASVIQIPSRNEYGPAEI